MYAVRGHSKQRQALLTLAQQDKFPSSLLLSGVAGIGKEGIAHELAQSLLCQNRISANLTSQSSMVSTEIRAGCGECSACKLSKAGTHPDLHQLDFGAEDSIKVEQVRELLDSLSLHAFLGGNKIAVFNNVDEISISAANILLKSLEEPRPGTYFILIATNPSRLPQTILSRCQRWFFDRLSVADIRLILDQNGITVSADVLEDSNGSLETIRQRTTNPEIWKEVEDCITAAYNGFQQATIKAAVGWAASKETLSDRLAILEKCLEQKLRGSAKDSGAAAVWSIALLNLLDIRYLIQDRNVSPQLCISALLEAIDRRYGDDYVNAPLSYPTIAEWLHLS